MPTAAAMVLRDVPSKPVFANSWSAAWRISSRVVGWWVTPGATFLPVDETRIAPVLVRGATDFAARPDA